MYLLLIKPKNHLIYQGCEKSKYHLKEKRRKENSVFLELISLQFLAKGVGLLGLRLQ